MTKENYYALNEYKSVAEVEAAAAEMLITLQTKPTAWCIVKRLNGNPTDGFNIPIDALTDEEILNISGDDWYSVAAVVSGFNESGLTAAQAIDAVNTLRAEYADYHRISIYTVIEEISTSQDFSAYLPQG